MGGAYSMHFDKNCLKILVGKLKGKIPLVRPRCVCDYIKYLREIGFWGSVAHRIQGGWGNGISGAPVTKNCCNLLNYNK
jgi:hypothetical protein